MDMKMYCSDSEPCGLIEKKRWLETVELSRWEGDLSINQGWLYNSRASVTVRKRIQLTLSHKSYRTKVHTYLYLHYIYVRVEQGIYLQIYIRIVNICKYI